MTTVDLKDAGAMYGKMGKELRAAAVRGLQRAALRGLAEIKARIIPSRTPQPVDRGVYRAGWNVELLSDGAAIYNPLPYAAMIEYGVKPGNVRIGAAMIQALSEWVVRKGLASSADAIRVAWRVARALQRKGIHGGGAGLGILKELEEGVLPRYAEEEVAREIGRVLG